MNKRGFSLLETLVALAILVTALLGPITLAAQSVRSIQSAKNQVTAVSLAQDAVEFIRAEKASNSFQRVAWLDGLDKCFNPALGCFVDTANNNIDLAGSCDQPTPPDDCYLQRSAITGAYTHDSDDQATIFIRRVKMDYLCPGFFGACGKNNAQEARINVEVKWQERHLERNVTVQTHIFCFERAFLADCDDDEEDGV